MRYLPILATIAVVILVWVLTPKCATLPPIPEEESAALTLINNTPYWLMVVVERAKDRELITESLLSPNTIPQIPDDPPTNRVTMLLSPETYVVTGVACTENPDRSFTVRYMAVIQITLVPGADETLTMNFLGNVGPLGPENVL